MSIMPTKDQRIEELEAQVQRSIDYMSGLEAELADLRGYSVQIWEDCPNPDCENGTIATLLPVNPPERELDPCPVCGGSGKRLKDGVVRVVRSERRDRWYQSFTGHVSGYVIPAEMVEGER